MYEDLVETDLPIARKSVVPGAGFFRPDSMAEAETDRRVRAALEGAETVVVADGDADGLGCVALIRERHDDVLVEPEPEPASESELDEESETTADDEPEPTPHRVALVPASPHDVEDALARVAEYAPEGISLYVCDLAPDRFEYVEEELAAAVEVASEVSWYDHHQWNEGVPEAVRDAGVELVVGDSETECSTDVVARSLEYDFEPCFEELAAVTRDHDLWLREDRRSDDLADYAYWSDAETYVEVVRAHGADLPEWVGDYLAERRVEKEQLIELAVSRAVYREIGDYTVGVTYGRCSQNEVAEAMRGAGADASVIVKPAGSASIRGTDAFELCHEVAGRVGGGGHPKAAGCKPDVHDDVLDYATHWTSRGAVTKQVILDAFRAVVAEDEGEEAAA